MRVFISWAKEPSRAVAESLRDWLPDIIQSLEPWMSSTDIGAGTRWSTKIAEALASTRIGILCITPDNQREPWLLFEAGALAKTLDDTFVCPYLIQMRAADLAPGPLTQFQSKLADQHGTFELLSTINSALGAEALPSDRLRRLFNRSWPEFERRLQALPTSPDLVRRPQEELLAEILDTVRSIIRRMPPADSIPIIAEDLDPWRLALIRELIGQLALPSHIVEGVRSRLRQLSDKDLRRLRLLRATDHVGFNEFFEHLMSSTPQAVPPQTE